MSEFAEESLQVVDNQKNNEINIIETPKKKRGRPRKKDVIDYGNDSEQLFPKKEPTLTQKRKRGRPRKRNVINIIGADDLSDDECCLYIPSPSAEELILSQPDYLYL